MSDKLHQNPNFTQDHENCSVDGTVRPVFGSPSSEEETLLATEESGTVTEIVSDNEAEKAALPAVHAETPAVPASEDAAVALAYAVSKSTDDITAILAEVDAMRAAKGKNREDAPAADSVSKAPVMSDDSADDAVHADGKAFASEAISGSVSPQIKGNRKKKRKKRKRFSFVDDVLRGIFPWKGDRPAEIIRKIIFLTALIAFGICLYLIGYDLYDRYMANALYDDMQSQYQPITTQPYQEPVMDVTPEGEVYEYLEYNQVADMFLGMNSDLVGYITIEGTKISYPVVQRKSTDPNINTNDYYLYRAFDLSKRDSGCIFMDFRCHFDEVVDHRRIVENSEHLLIYGHNMNTGHMFGTLKNYYRDYSYYSKHPIIQLDSLYKTYKYKIFAVFIVDGADTTSEYAFDCWNTFDFKDEAHFYEFVNQAKKRTLMTNDVDVKYGDQLLSLYTCNGLLDEAKLIVMARMVRDGEDLYEGTTNGQPNNNVLWPKAYYDYHSNTYDPELFVPYG